MSAAASDQAVLRLVEEMEVLLSEPGVLDQTRLKEWNRRFNEATVRAERGPGWSAIVDRAHALGGRVDRVVEGLHDQGRGIRGQLEMQERGARALRGYKGA
jgi:hypothetical protein